MAKTIQLTKTFTQFVETIQENVPESDLDITVEYDPEERDVTQIISVTAYSRMRSVAVDLTAIFHECLNLDQIIDKINWTEVYAETMADKKEVA